jgi:7-cyano-7-deazaguanine synthase
MSDRPKALLLLSGGLDSTVASFLAAETHEIAGAITFDYGQRARRRELGASYKIAAVLETLHRTVELGFYRQLESRGLTSPQGDLPAPSAADLDDPAAAEASASAVWVPNRNAVMIAVGAAWAESFGLDVLVVGFNVEEAQTFPDNGEEFLARQNEALALSTAGKVQVIAPTGAMTKAEIVALAQERDWPLELVWSCYEDKDEPCGRCESCCRFDRAVDVADAGAWLKSRRSRR